MRKYQYRKIEAFTSGGSLGNPTACLFLEGGQALSEAEMLGIARQHKGFVSEVVFCQRMGEAAIWLSYYSSECEVDFCGHGTIACAYALIRENPELMQHKRIELLTARKGSLVIYNEVAEHDAVFITAPEPRNIGTSLSVESVANALGLSADHLDQGKPIDLIDAGLRALIVPIDRYEDEVGMFPDEHALKTYCENNSIDIVLAFTVQTASPNALAHTRVFAPRFGYLEDPATGSGNSAFGYYLLKNGLWDGAHVAIEQGGADRLFNAVQLRTVDGRVQFGGHATTRIKGVYCL